MKPVQINTNYYHCWKKREKWKKRKKTNATKCKNATLKDTVKPMVSKTLTVRRPSDRKSIPTIITIGEKQKKCNQCRGVIVKATVKATVKDTVKPVTTNAGGQERHCEGSSKQNTDRKSIPIIITVGKKRHQRCR